MSDFAIKPATRQAIKPLVSLYSESGCGKTFSSLLLARGFAGPSGRIVLADSESGRGSLYADVIPGGYDTLEITAPFSPARYVEVVEALEKSGAAVGIIDSGSHEWEGQGGVLDMAAAKEEQSGKGLNVWKVPKMEHALFVQKLMRCSIPLIICLRAKYKTRQIKNAQGRTEIVKDENASPIQAEDFLFEMMAHAQILHDHSIVLTKWSHPSLKPCFPAKGPLTIEHGRLIAEWCNSGNKFAQPKPTDPIKALTAVDVQIDAEIKAVKLEIWNLTEPIHRGSRKALSQSLWDELLMEDKETWETLSLKSAKEILQSIKSKLEKQKATP